MDVRTVKLPAFLASALINGDVSGLECRCPGKDRRWDKATHAKDCDFAHLQAAYDYVAPGHFVSCDGESYFSWSCDLPGFNLGADMLDYTVLYTEEK